MISTTVMIAALQQATLTGVVRDGVDLEPIAFAQVEGLEVTAMGRAGDPSSVSRDAFAIDSVLLRSLPTILGDGRPSRPIGTLTTSGPLGF